MTTPESTTRRAWSQMPSWSSSSPTVLVRVGPKFQDHSRDFHIHQALLETHSAVFTTALAQPYRGTTTEQLLELPAENTHIFSIFANFVYTGKFYLGEHPDAPPSDPDLEASRLTQAWLLAQRLRSNTLKDAVTDAFKDKFQGKRLVPASVYATLYPASCRNAGIRKLLVDLAMQAGTDGGFYERMDVQADFSEYWNDVARAYQRLGVRQFGMAGPSTGGLEGVGCWYHEHEEGKGCYRSIFGG